MAKPHVPRSSEPKPQGSWIVPNDTGDGVTAQSLGLLFAGGAWRSTLARPPNAPPTPTGRTTAHDTDVLGRHAPRQRGRTLKGVSMELQSGSRPASGTGPRLPYSLLGPLSWTRGKRSALAHFSRSDPIRTFHRVRGTHGIPNVAAGHESVEGCPSWGRYGAGAPAPPPAHLVAAVLVGEG